LPGAKDKREPGENPGRSGHCKWGATCIVGHWRISGKAAGKALNHESGDLPGLKAV